MQKPAALFICFLTIIFAPIWRGYVTAKIWLWFIVPTFNAPVLSLATAIGLGLLIAFIAQPVTARKKEQRETWDLVQERVLLALLYPAFPLLFAWIVKQWI